MGGEPGVRRLCCPRPAPRSPPRPAAAPLAHLQSRGTTKGGETAGAAEALMTRRQRRSQMQTWAGAGAETMARMMGAGDNDDVGLDSLEYLELLELPRGIPMAMQRSQTCFFSLLPLPTSPATGGSRGSRALSSFLSLPLK